MTETSTTPQTAPSADDELAHGFRALRLALDRVTGAALPGSARNALARLAGVAIGADLVVILQDGDPDVTVRGRWQSQQSSRHVSLSRECVRHVEHGASWLSDDDGWSLGVPIWIQGRLWGAAIASGRGEIGQIGLAEERLGAFGGIVAAAVVNRDTLRELDRLLHEQSSLRYVAEKVAASTDPDEVFDIVVREVGLLARVQGSKILRYETDGTATFFAGWGPLEGNIPTGSRISVKGTSVSGRILATGAPARVDDYRTATGPIAQILSDAGLASAVGVPIRVGGQLWGAFVVGSTEGPLPPETEDRMAEFAGLVSSLVENLVAKQALLDSRARLVHAADSTRQRIERDLHDGVQQRLVAAMMATNLARDLVASGEDASGMLAEVDARLGEAIDQLRDISRGIHPSILSEGGLAPALRSLARRSGIPVQLSIEGDVPRADPHVEVAAYLVVSESLTNTLKHAEASRFRAQVSCGGQGLVIVTHDDGRGGADPALGSGLAGLSDRLEAIGGSLVISSPLGEGTTLTAHIPVAPVA